MMVANGMKLVGAGCICFGVNPFLGYTLVGIGAAAYSPAKYGILGELTTGDKLVKANGLMESSTIAAILLGLDGGRHPRGLARAGGAGPLRLVYGGAVVANLWIPKLPAARPGQSWRFTPMTHSFFSACKTLWRNGETRFSLVGTSLFWGAGVTLRFLLVLWVPVALGISNNAMPTYLNAMVAVGDRAGRGRGGEAGDAANGLPLHACRDSDWRRGDLLYLQHALLPGVWVCCCCSACSAASLSCRLTPCCRSEESIPLARATR
ncbi:Lysophospholipid transporter lplT [Raoultella terrigena]|uniref:Lysophospholipid transporter lplT n=1 Tax=Raoultella terrigena TaxID=577 RepID=A0A4U9D6J4_RAOTE|nr:Lysophospholipid transporter lplT [Raoultella terrigena]